MANKILILTDGKAGHENQSKAFARALGLEPEIVEVHFKSKFHKALSYLFDHLGILSLALLRFPVDAELWGRGVYKVVIGTGSGTFYAAKALARRLGVKCGVVLYPRGYRLSTFDCILAPSFDNPAPAPNVVEIPANLVANDAAFYAQGVAAFREHYKQQTGHELPSTLYPLPSTLCPLPTPTAVIIGGPNKCSTMSVDWMKQELDQIFSDAVSHRVYDVPASPVDAESFPRSSPVDAEALRVTPKTDHLFWVTTSRRTPPEVEALVDSYPWDYKLLYSKDHFNPIPAFVQLAKRLCVTAESTGMLSEACTFGTAEVQALDNLNPGPHKFRRFVENLRRDGYVDGSRKVDLSTQFAAARGLLGL